MALSGKDKLFERHRAFKLFCAKKNPDKIGGFLGQYLFRCPYLVRPTGLEPVHPFGHKHLKLACLPIPAQPHRYMPSIRLRVYYTFECMICQDIF